MFADGHWIRARGSEALVDAAESDLYLALAVRNAGAGIAVLQGWYLWPELVRSDVGHRALGSVGLHWNLDQMGPR